MTGPASVKNRLEKIKKIITEPLANKHTFRKVANKARSRVSNLHTLSRFISGERESRVQPAGSPSRQLFFEIKVSFWVHSAKKNLMVGTERVSKKKPAS